MNITLFSQILQKVRRDSFNSLVEQHQSNKHSKGNDAWSHLVTMLFCQFAKCESLNDICNGMRSATGDHNHLGVSKSMCKSSLSYNNEHRDWRLFESLYYKLVDEFSPGLKRNRCLLPKRKIYLLDSTTIDLCLKVFDWAKFRQKKGAIKLHTVLDYDTCMPVFMDVTDGKRHDARAAESIDFPEQSIVVADRGYINFKWMRELNESGAFFVIRGRENIKFSLKERPLDRNNQANKNIQYDWEVEPELWVSKHKYDKPLRMVQVYDEEKGNYFELLTNNFTWTASTISELYRRRWAIESFFKDIKTHLKIKSFVGTSRNAVLTQIWTAMITILLLKTLQKQAKYKWHLSNLVSFIRINLFVKIDLQKWLDKPFLNEEELKPPDQKQLVFF
jgi:hypothetical protein